MISYFISEDSYQIWDLSLQTPNERRDARHEVRLRGDLLLRPKTREHVGVAPEDGHHREGRPRLVSGTARLRDDGLRLLDLLAVDLEPAVSGAEQVLLVVREREFRGDSVGEVHDDLSREWCGSFIYVQKKKNNLKTLSCFRFQHTNY